MRFLQRNGLNSRNIQWFMTGKNKQQSWQDNSSKQTIISEKDVPLNQAITSESNAIYEKLETNLFPESMHLSFKDECGEYPTASSYAVWKVVKESENCTTPTNILIYNHHHSINHSLILIRKSV